MRTGYSLLRLQTWKMKPHKALFIYCTEDTIWHIKLWIKKGHYDYWNY